MIPFSRNLLFLFLTFTAAIFAQPNARKEINIPNIPGFKTLKCDLHLHSVFSDGYVWPTIRVEEAWREGLDVIAITDHLEYLPHRNDISDNPNRAYKIAKYKAEELGIVLIRGAEITRDMPPGHFNAIFLEDASKLKVENWLDAFKEAKEQNAYVFWNHPGWDGEPGEGIGKWYDEHTMLLENGYFQGIEIYNERDYYPEVFEWALENDLTMLGNSDSHFPTNIFYDIANGNHRPMTLVFAKNNTLSEIKDALLNKRTLVYFDNTIAGRKEFLEPLFYASLELKNNEIIFDGKGSRFIQIKNNSDLDFELITDDIDNGILSYDKKLIIYKNRTNLLKVTVNQNSINLEETFELKYKVKNLLTAPDKFLSISFPISVKINSMKKD